MNEYRKLFFFLHKIRRVFTFLYDWTWLIGAGLSLQQLTEDGVHEQHFSSVHIWGKLCVVDLRFLGLLVALDEDLSDPD